MASTGVWKPTHCSKCGKQDTFFMYLTNRENGLIYYRQVCVDCWKKAKGGGPTPPKGGQAEPDKTKTPSK